MSASIPLQIHFVDLTVAPRCYHITNIEVFDDEEDNLIPSKPQCAVCKQMPPFSLMPRSWWQPNQYLFCKTSSPSLPCHHLLSEMSRWYCRRWSSSLLWLISGATHITLVTVSVCWLNINFSFEWTRLEVTCPVYGRHCHRWVAFSAVKGRHFKTWTDKRI